MPDTFVTVTSQWTSPTSATTNKYGNGNFEFVAAGTLMDSAAIAIVYPFISGQLDSLGSLSVPAGSPGSAGTGGPGTGVSLLASDNFGAGELQYNIKVIVQGLPSVNAFGIPVNFSNGASQGLFTLLEAAGWTAATF